MTLLLALACTTDGATDFTGGDFQLTTTAVSDYCYDGAMVTIFLPEGDGTTNEWANATTLPGLDELPSTYTIQLQEPFSDMEVTMEAGADATSMHVHDASQDGVLINEAWDDCYADLSFSADITIVDADNVTGFVEVTTSNAVGDSCEEMMGGATECTVELDLTGTRL